MFNNYLLWLIKKYHINLRDLVEPIICESDRTKSSYSKCEQLKIVETTICKIYLSGQVTCEAV